MEIVFAILFAFFAATSNPAARLQLAEPISRVINDIKSENIYDCANLTIDPGSLLIAGKNEIRIVFRAGKEDDGLRSPFYLMHVSAENL